jgi:tRNA-specific 2-thiouridylase
MEKGKSKKVLLGMSGGVDSCVSAYLLKQMGYDVTGAYLKLHSYSNSSDAKSVADTLGIPFMILDMEKEFKKEIIEYFISEYEAGRTPNPCTACNRYIKFEALTKKANELKIDIVATGHYANIEKNKGRYLLKKAKDTSKDQSYVLYNLTQEQLSKTLFPLGQLTKKEVREIAQKVGLKVASKPDSQEICFIPDNDYKGYIKKNSSNKPIPGDFISKDRKILGKHQGISNYTIGQRRGLGVVTGSPVFVLDIIPQTNQIILGSKEDLLSKELIVKNLNWISITNLTKEMEADLKIRYRAKESKAKIIPIDNSSVKVIFKSPQRAITKGQSAVFYDGDLVIGGGTIS